MSVRRFVLAPEVMKGLHALIPNLCSWSRTGLDEIKYGRDAFKELMAALERVDLLENMEEYSTFSWLGSSDEQQRIKDKQALLLAADDDDDVDDAPLEKGEAAPASLGDAGAKEAAAAAAKETDKKPAGKTKKGNGKGSKS